jgi:hypothetical protein
VMKKTLPSLGIASAAIRSAPHPSFTIPSSPHFEYPVELVWRRWFGGGCQEPPSLGKGWWSGVEWVEDNQVPRILLTLTACG